jgi:DNA-binding NarL/FixJ family response regulator
METQLDLQPARILIADDHPAMAKGIQSELAPYPHVAVVAMVPTFEAVFLPLRRRRLILCSWI